MMPFDMPFDFLRVLLLLRRKCAIMDRNMKGKDEIGMNIRPMRREDADAVIAMMQVFYASPAVLTDGSVEIFANDVEACVGDSPYAEGYVFDCEGQICGYAMLAKSYSTEFGKPCIWIEDIYVKEAFRGQGMGGAFLRFVQQKYPHAVLRLEAERENGHAVHVYEKCGFRELPYLEMIKE